MHRKSENRGHTAEWRAKCMYGLRTLLNNKLSLWVADVLACFDPCSDLGSVVDIRSIFESAR